MVLQDIILGFYQLIWYLKILIECLVLGFFKGMKEKQMGSNYIVVDDYGHCNDGNDVITVSSIDQNDSLI